MAKAVFSIQSSGNDAYAYKIGPAGGTYPPDSGVATNTTNTIIRVYDIYGTSTTQYSHAAGLLRWDTSALPDNAIINSASLKAWVTYAGTADYLNLIGDWYVWSNAITDYTIDATLNNAIENYELYNLYVRGDVYIPLRNLSNINRTGITSLRMQVKSTAPPTGFNLLEFASFDNTSGFPVPQLVIDYTVPVNDEIMADGPVGYWRFGEASGTIANDETINNLDGTYVNTPTFNVPTLDPSGNAAVTFARTGTASTNEYMKVAHSSAIDITSTEFTFVCWIKRTSVNNVINQIFGKGLDAYHGYINASNQVVFAADLSTAVTSTVTIADTEWHHLAFVRSGTSWKIYIDLIDRSGTVTQQTAWSTPLNFCIGVSETSNNNSFHGTIDEPAIFNKALSINRIKAQRYAVQRNYAIYKGKQTQQGSEDLGITTRTWDRPPVVKQGDLMLLVSFSSHSSIAWTIPEGWTSGQLISGQNYRIAWKIAKSNEPTTYSFTLGDGTTTTTYHFYGVILVFEGTSKTAPINVRTDIISNVSNTAWIAPDATTTVNGALPMRITGAYNNSTATYYVSAVPKGYEIYENFKNFSGTSKMLSVSLEETQVGKGPLGTSEPVVSSGSSPYESITLALAPEVEPAMSLTSVMNFVSSSSFGFAKSIGLTFKIANMSGIDMLDVIAKHIRSVVLSSPNSISFVKSSRFLNSIFVSSSSFLDIINPYTAPRMIALASSSVSELIRTLGKNIDFENINFTYIFSYGTMYKDLDFLSSQDTKVERSIGLNLFISSIGAFLAELRGATTNDIQVFISSLSQFDYTRDMAVNIFTKNVSSFDYQKIIDKLLTTENISRAVFLIDGAYRVVLYMDSLSNTSIDKGKSFERVINMVNTGVTTARLARTTIPVLTAKMRHAIGRIGI